MLKLSDSTFTGRWTAFLETTPLSYRQACSNKCNKVALQVLAAIPICIVASILLAVDGALYITAMVLPIIPLKKLCLGEGRSAAWAEYKTYCYHSFAVLVHLCTLGNFLLMNLYSEDPDEQMHRVVSNRMHEQYEDNWRKQMNKAAQESMKVATMSAAELQSVEATETDWPVWHTWTEEEAEEGSIRLRFTHLEHQLIQDQCLFLKNCFSAYIAKCDINRDITATVIVKKDMFLDIEPESVAVHGKVTPLELFMINIYNTQTHYIEELIKAGASLSERPMEILSPHILKRIGQLFKYSYWREENAEIQGFAYEVLRKFPQLQQELPDLYSDLLIVAKAYYQKLHTQIQQASLFPTGVDEIVTSYVTGI